MVTMTRRGQPVQQPAAHRTVKRQDRPDRRFGSRSAYYGTEEYKHMPLINIVIALIIVGMGLYLINRFIPMASSIKTILNVVVVVAVCIWVLQSTGLWAPISNYRLSR